MHAILGVVRRQSAPPGQADQDIPFGHRQGPPPIQCVLVEFAHRSTTTTDEPERVSFPASREVSSPRPAQVNVAVASLNDEPVTLSVAVQLLVVSPFRV